jgi:hypothetical protein
MAVYLPGEVPSSISDMLDEFGKRISAEIRLYLNDTQTAFDIDPLSSGDYSAVSGEYDFGKRVWLKKVGFSGINPGDDICAVFYRDINGNDILISASELNTITFKYPVYAQVFSFFTYLSTDQSPVYTPPGNCIGWCDVYTDITKYCGNNISKSSKVDKLGGEILLPHTKVSLNKQSGMWSRSVSKPTIDNCDIKGGIDSFAGDILE